MRFSLKVCHFFLQDILEPPGYPGCLCVLTGCALGTSRYLPDASQICPTSTVWGLALGSFAVSLCSLYPYRGLGNPLQNMIKTPFKNALQELSPIHICLKLLLQNSLFESFKNALLQNFSLINLQKYLTTLFKYIFVFFGELPFKMMLKISFEVICLNYV